MKPFDLEAAKRGEPICTRDGTPVEFVAHLPNALAWHRVVFLQSGRITTADEQGHYTGAASVLDLFMSPRKRTVWVNLYPDRSTSTWYHTEREANGSSSPDRLGGKAYPIEIEE